MIDKKRFVDDFGDWWPKIEPLFDNGVMDRIFSFLKSRGKEGYKILPESRDVFRCFRLCPLSSLKVVMMGMAPYNTLRGNKVIADGLLMSCSNTGILQPSLESWYSGIEKEYKDGMNLHMDKSPDLSYLAHQGVLLCNAAFTTEIGKASAHAELWKPFTVHLLENIISLTGVPVIFLGADASKFKGYLAPMQWNFSLSHPVSSLYIGTKWNTEGVYKKVDRILLQNNNVTIHWWKQ